MVYILAGYGASWAPMIDEQEIRAFKLFQTAKITYTQPWALVKEDVCDWWINRILIFERAMNDAQEILLKQKH